MPTAEEAAGIRLLLQLSPGNMVWVSVVCACWKRISGTIWYKV